MNKTPVLAIVDRDDKKVRLLEGVHFTPTSLQIERRLTYKEADHLVYGLFDPLGKALQFMWGDMLLYCEKVFPDKWTQLVPEGYVTKTAGKWMRVCSKIPPALRREELSFTHHEIIADKFDSNADIKAWLEKAVTEGMDTKELRKTLNPSKAKKACPECGGENKVCPDCGHKY